MPNKIQVGDTIWRNNPPKELITSTFTFKQEDRII